MKKRISILLFALISLFLLTGWGGKEVRLLNSDQLIKLDEAIKLAKPGGISGDTEEASETDKDADTEEEPESKKSDDKDAADTAPKDIAVRVRGEQIFYACGDINGGNITDAELKERIRSDYARDAQVTLTEDYAEAHVYRKVLGIMEELKNDIGLSWKEDQSGGGE